MHYVVVVVVALVRWHYVRHARETWRENTRDGGVER